MTLKAFFVVLVMDSRILLIHYLKKHNLDHRLLVVLVFIVLFQQLPILIFFARIMKVSKNLSKTVIQIFDFFKDTMKAYFF